MDDKGLCDKICDLHALIQTGGRILEDHLSAGLEHFFVFREGIPVKHVDALVEDFPALRSVDIHDAACDRGFARAGFSHEAEDLPLPDGEGHLINGLDIHMSCQAKAVRECLNVQ